MESNEKTNEINYYLEHLTEIHRENFWLNDDGSLSDWKLNFNEKKKLTPFVGLKNLGCTCYMNSLLQVFYNLIPFRESLLKCECKEEKKNSLYQIKKLFYCLKYLRINYYIPEELTKNFDNEILNVHQQMDVDEFYINILDKIENRLKKTKNENLVKYFFQGRLNDVLNFQKGCTHHRTNTNNFYSIQLQVQNKKNLYESLDALTEGELMDGDNCIYCPHCDKKVPVMKSQNFQKLPRILIFVLKRFEFNYDTMIKVKINDFYEFPYESV
jgi:ubiquitin carboxyl-terminal hydrolase 9/24